jgi:hypothetical protein
MDRHTDSRTDTKTQAGLQELTNTFRKACEETTQASPDLAGFLPPPNDPLRKAALQELIKLDLEIHWQRQKPCWVEEYLRRFPELKTAHEVLAQVLYHEYRVRQRYGDQPQPADYQTRFPEQYPEVERLIKDEQTWATMAPSVTPAAPPTAQASASSLAAHSQLLPPGEGYKLIKRLGAGAYGEVWRAEAPGGVEVAIKIIFRPLQHADAQRELQALEVIKRLHHPFLAQIHAYWSMEDRLVIAMELAEGSLRDRLKECQQAEQPGIPVPELLVYFREAAEALDYLQSQHVLHRDIKPDNILVLKRHTKVADFGLARLQEFQRQVATTTTGTPAYMAPEVWRGKVSERSDQYSLALSYAELRTGKMPFGARDMFQLMMDHMEKPPDLEDFPEAEGTVLAKALAKNPDERYASCHELVEALAAAVPGFQLRTEELPVMGTGPGSTAHMLTATATFPTQVRKRGRWPWVAAGLLLPVLLVLGFLLLYQKSDAAAVSLPPGYEKVGEETATDREGKKYYKRLRPTAHRDRADLDFLVIPKRQKTDPETFYMMENKVSVGAFREFAAAHPDLVHSQVWNQQAGDALPVLGVTGEDAHGFATEWLGGNLPTVDQWYKATGLNEPETEKDEGPYRGNWDGPQKPQLAIAREREGPLPVGQAADDISFFGCKDMAGNGLEWTRSVVASRQTVPLANPAPNIAVQLCGLSYDAPEPLRFRDLKSRDENHIGALEYGKTLPDVGFRVVLEP